MQSPDPYAALLTEARERPQLWRLVTGVVLALFVYIGVVALQAVVLFAVVGPMDFFGWIQRLNYPTEAVPTLLTLATFIGMFLGPILAAAALHFRPVRSLVGPWRQTGREFLTVLAVALPLYTLLLVGGMLLEPPQPNLPWATWAMYLPLALPLLLVQVSAEELLFRGYMQSQLAVRFLSRLPALLVPSLLFASLHFNPQAGALAWMILGATFVFALIAADLTFRTGSLGAAIGLHFVNNLFGLLIVAMSGTITGLARWTTPYSFDQPQALALSIGFNVVFLVVLWRVLRLALGR